MKKLLVPALAVLGLCASLPALANTQAQTKNPIVLVPGIFAFDTIATIDYWYKIPSALQSQGAKVHVPKINAFDSSAKRGESLIAQLEQIRAASGGTVKKFNLIGHSQGGLTARYVMNTRPDLVASVTTLNSPHKGSPLADLVTGIAPPGSLQGVAFDVFANTVGNLVNLLNPDVVVLGGCYAPVFPELAPHVADGMASRALAQSGGIADVVPSALGSAAQLHGAAELCLADTLANPTVRRRW